MTEIAIGSRKIGGDEPCLIIAEVGNAHDGSLGNAYAYVDAAAAAGVDAVKFQTHFAEHESTIQEPFRIKFSKQDATRYDYWRRISFKDQEWADLADYARSKGLIFLSTPFSVYAVQLLDRLGTPAWKVGSGEFRSFDILDAMVKTRKPVLLSSGMSKVAEIESAANFFKKHQTPFAVFQCTTSYPNPLEKVGLNVIDVLKRRIGCPVGLSDHSGKIYPSLAAMARGADMIEVHIAFDRRQFGPDSTSSLTLEELKILVEARNAFEVMDTNPIDKDVLVQDMSHLRSIFSRSLALSRPYPAGTTIDDTMLVLKKPGSGISPDERHAIVGKRLKVDYDPSVLLDWKHLE